MCNSDVAIGTRRGRGIKISDEQLIAFARSYEAWKKNGLYPVEIRDKMTEALDIGSTTYYRYLRMARQKNYITDTYAETTAKSIEARRQWLLAHGGKIKGIKFYFPQRIIKGQIKQNAKTTQPESTTTLKALCKKAKEMLFKS